MSTDAKCPVCGKERSFLSGCSCGNCGFQSAYVRYFAGPKSYEWWLGAVREAQNRWINTKRAKLAFSNRFWVGDHAIALFDEQEQSIHIVFGSGRVQTEQNAVYFSAGALNDAVLYADGTVKVFGEDNACGQKNTEAWRNIRKILSAPNCTYGITEAGEVVYAGALPDPSVLNWRRIKSLKAGGTYLAGLHLDGTVSVAGSTAASLEAAVQDWTGITEIEAVRDCILGLTADGTVRFAGKAEDPRRAAEAWKDILALSADNSYVYGLSADGRVYTAGSCRAFLDKGRSAAAGWEHMIALACNRAGVGTISEQGDLVFAGTVAGDLTKMKEAWERQMKARISFQGNADLTESRKSPASYCVEQ